MPKFSYIASNSQGQSVKGALQANNKNEVAKLLSAKGLFMVTCKLDEAVTAAGAMIPTAQSMSAPPMSFPPMTASRTTLSGAPPISTPRGSNPHQWWAAFTAKQNETNPKVRPRGKISLKELAVLTRQLSISINAGMSFVDALQGMAVHNKNPLMAYTLRSVLDNVLAGKKFSEALALNPDIFETFYVSMAAAGEAGGFMPDALNRIAEFLEKEMELRSKIKSAMIYPVVIAFVAMLVVTGMMAYIVPTFVKVFQEMNAPLPWPTQLLVKVSYFTRHGGFLCPFGVVALYLFMQRLRKSSEQFRVFYDERVLGVPLFGKIMTLEIITRFIRTLASLADNGVAILLSLSVARQVVGNRTIEKVVDEIYSSVQQGNGISPILYKSQHFPVLVANMVATGEKTGSIPEVLMKMASYYDAEVGAAVRDLLTLMEPMLIVVMAVIVGFIVAGLMLPTFQMSSLVQG